MIRSRGRPGELRARLDRVRAIADSPTVGEPLALLGAVLEHQLRRSESPTVVAAAALLAAGGLAEGQPARVPLLELTAAADPVLAELDRLVGDLLDGPAAALVPAPLATAGRALQAMPPAERAELVAAWLDDAALLDPRLGFWVQAGAGPILELAAASLPPVGPSQWHGRACPYCGGMPQVSVIAERPGDFLGGSPRSLVCGRCASWWSFPRATCADCGEDNPERLAPHVAQGLGWVRIDGCQTCSGYSKTFDLREDGARDVVPLVDDVASVSLDLWAHSQGLRRATRSVAGV